MIYKPSSFSWETMKITYVKIGKSMYPPVSSNMAGTSLNKMEVYSWKIIYKSINGGCGQIHRTIKRSQTYHQNINRNHTNYIKKYHDNDISQYTIHFLNIGYTGYIIIVRS